MISAWFFETIFPPESTVQSIQRTDFQEEWIVSSPFKKPVSHSVGPDISASNEPFPDQRQRLIKLFVKLISLFSLMTSYDGTRAPLCSNNHKISHYKLIQLLTLIVLSFTHVTALRNMVGT